MDRSFLNYILVFLAAGAVGNLIDRIAHTYVVDFIYFKLINFPIFNFADICVSLSAVILVVFFIFVFKEDPEFVLLGGKMRQKVGNHKLRVILCLSDAETCEGHTMDRVFLV